MSALLCGSDRLRAEEPREAVEGLDVELSEENDLSTIADAHAQFTPVLPPSDPPLLSSDWSSNILAYMGIDGWRHGGSAYAGAEWSPAPQSAFILRAFASDGFDEFRSASIIYRSETARASLLPGYRVRNGTLDIKLFAGADFMLRMPLRPVVESSRSSFGARASADVWWEPAKSWMLSGSVSATTIERGISGRLASGWRSPFGWIGPEVLATHDIYNTQYRAGAHVSGFQVGMTEWSFAGGYAHDSFGRGGPYGRLGITYRAAP